MPRPSEYTPTRRYIMQGVMWLILGGTVALAAMVTQKQRLLHRVDLSSQSLSGGNVSVRLPAKWRARPRGDEDVRVIAQAAEGSPGEEGRRLRVLSERIDVP